MSFSKILAAVAFTATASLEKDLTSIATLSSALTLKLNKAQAVVKVSGFDKVVAELDIDAVLAIPQLREVLRNHVTNGISSIVDEHMGFLTDSQPFIRGVVDPKELPASYFEAIYEKYIATGAPLRINLGNDELKPLVQMHKALSQSDDEASALTAKQYNILEGAYKKVKEMMKKDRFNDLTNKATNIAKIANLFNDNDKSIRLLYAQFMFLTKTSPTTTPLTRDAIDEIFKEFLTQGAYLNVGLRGERIMGSRFLESAHAIVKKSLSEALTKLEKDAEAKLYVQDLLATKEKILRKDPKYKDNDAAFLYMVELYEKGADAVVEVDSFASSFEPEDEEPLVSRTVGGFKKIYEIFVNDKTAVSKVDLSDSVLTQLGVLKRDMSALPDNHGNDMNNLFKSAYKEVHTRFVRKNMEEFVKEVDELVSNYKTSEGGKRAVVKSVIGAFQRIYNKFIAKDADKNFTNRNANDNLLEWEQGSEGWTEDKEKIGPDFISKLDNVLSGDVEEKKQIIDTWEAASAEIKSILRIKSILSPAKNAGESAEPVSAQILSPVIRGKTPSSGRRSFLPSATIPKISLRGFINTKIGAVAEASDAKRVHGGSTTPIDPSLSSPASEHSLGNGQMGGLSVEIAAGPQVRAELAPSSLQDLSTVEPLSAPAAPPAERRKPLTQAEMEALSESRRKSDGTNVAKKLTSLRLWTSRRKRN
jgi:hypothetical protein